METGKEGTPALAETVGKVIHVLSGMQMYVMREPRQHPLLVVALASLA